MERSEAVTPLHVLTHTQNRKQTIIDHFLTYTEDSDINPIYFRWSIMTCISAAIGRKCYIQRNSESVVFPQLYTMLVGEPGAGKGTSIEGGRLLLQEAGYRYFSAVHSSTEKFFSSLKDGYKSGGLFNGEDWNFNFEDIPEPGMWDRNCKEAFICVRDFHTFTGHNNRDMCRLFAAIWNWHSTTHPMSMQFRGMKETSIYQPTLNMLAGSTPTNLALAFPSMYGDNEFLGQTIFVFSDKPLHRSRQQARNNTLRELVVKGLREILKVAGGQLSISKNAQRLLEDISHLTVRFQNKFFNPYLSHRSTHILKICILVAVMNGTDQITDDIVVYAHTVISAAERYMNNVVGLVGASKDSIMMTKLYNTLKDAKAPMGIADIHAQFFNEMDYSSFRFMMENLKVAGKIQEIHSPNGQVGFLAQQDIVLQTHYVDYSVLTEREQKELKGEG